MTSNVRLQQLYILRAQVDILIAMEEGIVPEQPVECPHPEEKRVDATNMGQEPHFYCKACGQDVLGRA